MSGTGRIVTICPGDYDAVLFDLDGVLTRTATVHAAAWKRLFDDFLKQRAAESGEEFIPFDIDSDYLRYVDGKPRFDGVASFLESRGLSLPLGEPGDGPDAGTVHALGNLKDRYFTEYLKEHGVEPYQASIALVRSLRSEDIRTAVVSSSNNCEAVLDAVGIAQLFDTRVDGIDITRLGLEGKPAPDAFLEAARRLRADPARSVVVEDATSGVAAGRAGGFGLVVGVDRVAQSQALRKAGANVVVNGLEQVRVAAASPSAWSLVYEEFEPSREGMREALCALGNGYFETRGAATWAEADGVHYPGTYVAGAYNRIQTDIAGRTVENEDLVNFPNWLALGFRIGTGDWFDEREVAVLAYRQELDLRHGVLLKTISFEDDCGRRSTLTERRLVSMADMHKGAVELTLVAENWSGKLAVRSAIDGRIVNAGALLYREFNNRHLVPLQSEATDTDQLYMLVQASQSKLQVAEAVRTRVFRNGKPEIPPRQVVDEPGYIAHEFSVDLSQGDSLVLEKILALYTSRDRAISESGLAARNAIAHSGSFDDLLNAHVLSWKYIWRRFDIRVRPAAPGFNLNVPMLLRLNILHLLQAASLNSVGLDIGVPPRGWTGEAYQGHVFWDELFIFPFLTLRTPEITRSLLMYRYHRLGAARAAAKNAGFEGAMFPWQSGSDGQEETQELNLNRRSRRWLRDNTWLQRHVGSAVAYNVWHYFQITCDTEFLQFYGAEMILDIARFWSSIASFNEQRGRYEIHGVMGPDEFHDAYPDAPEPGLSNNAYTNLMAVWVLCRALEVLELLPDSHRVELMRRLGLTGEETARWEDISRRMFVPFHDGGIISQFEGFEKLAELDWNRYRLRYRNIQRLELILEAENDSANHYKVVKQADVLMLFYLFSADELGDLFRRLGYPLEYDTIPRNVEYYDCLSSHGSTLSRVVHAWVLARSDRPRAMKYFAEALQSDVDDIQQGTTAEGVHLGAMAGTVDLVQRVTTGIEVSGHVLRLNPQLPDELECIDMRLRYRGHSFDIRVTRDRLTVRGRERGLVPVNLAVGDEVFEFDGDGTRVFELARDDAPAARKTGSR
jgi:beta-phosphoglucomutase family hydrolase